MSCGSPKVKTTSNAWPSSSCSMPGLSRARRDSFTLEIRTLAQLNHPHIACLYNAGTLNNGTPWFAMEFVSGVSFDAACRGISDVRDFISIFRKVCEAVRYAHSQGVIHRDLKPTNILVIDAQTPKLLDFGIARQISPAHESQPLQCRSALSLLRLRRSGMDILR